MSGFLCAMVGASFTVAAVAQVLRSKKSVIAYNNAQVSTAQSKFGVSSALFDGTSDYLAVEHDSALKFGTGNFTIEFWYRPIARTNNFAVLLSNSSEFVTGNIQIDDRNNATPTKFSVFIVNNSNSAASLVSTTTVANGTWYHLALVRNGTNIGLYVNGTSEASITVASNFVVDDSANTTGYQIGAYYNGDSTTIINGYIDEIRISNSARYTTTFTPSTTPFVNDANTVFLMHANGTNGSTFFEDDNGIGRSARGISAIGNAQLSTAQSKFGGASALFDGNGDYLQLANSSDYNFTGNYTIEGWWYQPSNVAAGIYPTLIGTGAVDDNKGWEVTSEPTNNKISFITSPNGSSGMSVLLTSASLSAATWNHWAIVRNSSVLTLYINGTASGSTYTTTGNSIASTYPLYIGGGVGGLSSGNFSSSSATVVNLNGYLDEIRISNIARYTTTFTPSTTPFVNDTNTLLLMHADGTNASTVFRDDNGARTQQSIQVNGNAQTDTAISKFGGSSLLLDGTGDAIQCSDDAMRFNASANRTIEFWIYSDRNNTTEVFLFQGVNTGGTMDYWQWYFTSNGLVLNIPGSSPADVTLTRNTATWYHFAWVKQSNSNTVYWNGTSVATFTKTDSDWGLTDNNTLFIGFQQGATTAFDGNIDEFRISSSARYTANFTPSTTPFQNDANTVLLLHMDGTDASTAFFDDNGIAPYTP